MMDLGDNLSCSGERSWIKQVYPIHEEEFYLWVLLEKPESGTWLFNIKEGIQLIK